MREHHPRYLGTVLHVRPVDGNGAVCPDRVAGRSGGAPGPASSSDGKTAGPTERANELPSCAWIHMRNKRNLCGYPRSKMVESPGFFDV